MLCNCRRDGSEVLLWAQRPTSPSSVHPTSERHEARPIFGNAVSAAGNGGSGRQRPRVTGLLVGRRHRRSGAGAAGSPLTPGYLRAVPAVGGVLFADGETGMTGVVRELSDSRAS